MRRGAAGIAAFATSLALLAGGVATSRCGSKPSSDPTPAPTSQSGSPSAPTPAPASITFTLSGFVNDSTSRGPIPGATVGIVTGPNANRAATTDANGTYSIPNLSGGTFTLHTEARGYLASDQDVTLSANARLNVTLDRQPECNAQLWTHVYDPTRLKVKSSCVTLTGVIATQHNSDDGDIDMRLVPDPPFMNLVNAANNGRLQIEAVCQGRINPNTPAASISCRDFSGNVLLPPVGTHVQVTGSYVLDTNHGWMEIHPITEITIIR